jgi:hypothetical protein
VKINVNSERFRTAYDSTRVRWGLPDGAEHARIMAHAAVCIVSGDAQKRGHNPQVQGLALECSRCGMSCAIDREGWTVKGPLAREKCDGVP